MKIFKNLNPLYRKIIFLFCVAACAVLPVDPPIALLLGIIIALTFGNPFIQYNQKATHLLLQISVVGLGFGINLFHAYEAGKQGLIFTISTIAITLLAGYMIGKMLKIDSKTSFLISNGTAICGGSAIAAVAPILKTNEKQMSVALGTIFILNSVALLLFPFIGHYLGLNETQFGTWCAIAIHDTSSVVGAAAKYGEKALQIATTIKLERALWIIPISLATAYVQKSSGNKIKIPYFIFLYVAAMIIATYYPLAL
ncbi:MAG TPA: putative sulfate exporter family transporter, partial [Ignavibacteria bacterium]